MKIWLNLFFCWPWVACEKCPGCSWSAGGAVRGKQPGGEGGERPWDCFTTCCAAV